MYCRFREPSWLLFRSPGGIDPLSWLPVKPLKEPKCVWRELTPCIGARQLDKANSIGQILTERLVKIIVKSHQELSLSSCCTIDSCSIVYVRVMIGSMCYRDHQEIILLERDRSRTDLHIQILDGLEICKERWYVPVQTTEGYVPANIWQFSTI